MRRNGKDRHAASMAIEETVDEMEVAWSAASGADGDLTGKVSLGARGKSSHFLMPYVEPVNLFVLADGVGEAIEGVARNAVDSFHARVN